MRSRVVGAFLLFTAAASATAGAASVAGYGDLPYASGMAVYEVPDSARSAEIGWGYQFNGGIPLRNHPHYSLELAYSDLSRRRNIDQQYDYQQSLFVNGVRDLGYIDWMHLHPFVIAGAGGVRDDVRGSARINPGLDLGAGILVPLGFRGWALRLQALTIGSWNLELADGEDKNFYVDYHLMLGLEVPFSLRAKPAAEPPPPPPPQADASCAESVDPITGKKSCVSDSDHDGVPDEVDQCPGTPAGIAVDYKGCPVATQDADGDGVPDAADACPGTLAGVKVDERGCAIEQTTIVPDINFAYASATLDDKSTTVLDNIADMMKSQPDLRAEVGGHTDNNVHFPEKNRLLSQRRAEVVRDYLVARGIESSRLSAAGYGDTKPIVSNDTADGRAQNRRVELKFSRQQP